MVAARRRANEVDQDRPRYTYVYVSAARRAACVWPHASARVALTFCFWCVGRASAARPFWDVANELISHTQYVE